MKSESTPITRANILLNLACTIALTMLAIVAVNILAVLA